MEGEQWRWLYDDIFGHHLGGEYVVIEYNSEDMNTSLTIQKYYL